MAKPVRFRQGDFRFHSSKQRRGRCRDHFFKMKAAHMRSPKLYADECCQGESSPCFDPELTVLLLDISGRRRINDLRIAVIVVSQRMYWSLPISFEPQEEPFIL